MLISTALLPRSTAANEMACVEALFPVPYVFVYKPRNYKWQLRVCNKKFDICTVCLYRSISQLKTFHFLGDDSASCCWSNIVLSLHDVKCWNSF